MISLSFVTQTLIAVILECPSSFNAESLEKVKENCPYLDRLDLSHEA